MNGHSVRKIKEDSRGNLWLATDKGLNRLEGTTFIHYTEGNGLSNNHVTFILEDNQQNIWVATRKGLNVLVPPSEESVSGNEDEADDYRLFSFGMADGLEEVDFSGSARLDSQNRIWWRTGVGLTMLDLNQFQLPSDTPDIRLNTIRIKERFIDYRRLRDTAAYQQTLSFGGALAESYDSVARWYNYPVEMKLPHYINRLSFEFSGIDWSAPHKLKYSYIMSGLDNGWSLPVAENKADYRNLPPGNYTFKVKAISAAQIWSPVFEYDFRILPPWWFSRTARISYIILVFLLLYYVYRFLLDRKLKLAEAGRLKELNDYKIRLYANITHEFRTPLTIILGMIRQIKDNPKKWYNEGLQMIDRNGRQLLGLVNQMLDLSKLDKGRLKLKMQQGEVVGFIHYLLQSFESYAAGKDIQLHFLKEVDQLEMDFDPDQLMKVVGNLLSNAVKYTPAGGQVYVIVDSRQSTGVGQRDVKEDLFLSGPTPGLRSAKEYLLLKVKDTGPGIASEELSRIFDRFYQVDNSNTRKAAGAGLGLALTKELVRLMGGEIQVQSKIGEGTDFIVSLPVNRSLPKNDAAADWANRDLLVNDAIDVSAAVAAIEGINSRERAAKGDLLVVLLIEDNRDVLTYLASCLESEYQLEFAMNGQEGIEQALEIVPDIIVSDVMMPEKDGYEVCAALKNDIRTSHIPIILLTAKADRDAKLEGLKAGADAYLAKPFDQEELEVRIEKLMDLRKKLQARYSQLKPRSEKEEKLRNKEELFLEYLRKIIEENLSDEGFGIAQLCRKIGMSRSQLHNKLKALTGKSTSIYIRSIRLEKAKILLRTTDWNISEVAYAAGFRTSLYFTQIFSEEVGMAPSVYRMNNE